MDRQGIDLALNRLPDGIADRRVDLAGDLGHRHPGRDEDPQLDPNPGAQADDDRRWSQAEADEELSGQAVVGQAGDAVAAEHGGTHDLADRPTADEQLARFVLGGARQLDLQGRVGLHPEWARRVRRIDVLSYRLLEPVSARSS